MKKTDSRALPAIKTGAVSVARARKAARIAKAARPPSASVSSKSMRQSATWERYLGHFGVGAAKSSIKNGKPTAKPSPVKKASDAKTGALRKRSA